MNPHRHSGPSYAGLRIGLMGGSFNPAHEGHLAISLHALKQLQLDQIWWLVSPQNPLKSITGMAPFAERLKRAHKLARHPRIIASDLESHLGTRYSYDTLRALQRHFLRTQFVWLMGADNMQQLPKWHKGMEIFDLVPVAVFRRPTYAAGRGLGKAAQRFEKAWLPTERGKLLSTYCPPAWTILDNQYNKLSATAIRQNAKNRKGQ